MPSSVVTALIERVAKLEAKVESLLALQKWELGILAALFLVALKGWIRN